MSATTATTMTMTQITSGSLNGRAPGDPDAVLAAGEQPAVEPAVADLDLEAAHVEQHAPLHWGKPRERHGGGAGRASDREGERARGGVPVGALEDARLALQPAAVGLLDVVLRRGEDVEDEAAARWEEIVNGGERADPLRVGLEVQERAEGADHERRSGAGRRLADVAAPQVEALGHAGLGGGRPRDGEHSLRRVDADHIHARLRDRDGDPAGANPELEDRPSRALRLVHVEVDVLGRCGSTRRTGPRSRRRSRAAVCYFG